MSKFFQKKNISYLYRDRVFVFDHEILFTDGRCILIEKNHRNIENGVYDYSEFSCDIFRKLDQEIIRSNSFPIGEFRYEFSIRGNLIEFFKKNSPQIEAENGNSSDYCYLSDNSFFSTNIETLFHRGFEPDKEKIIGFMKKDLNILSEKFGKSSRQIFVKNFTKYMEFSDADSEIKILIPKSEFKMPDFSRVKKDLLENEILQSHFNSKKAIYFLKKVKKIAKISGDNFVRIFAENDILFADHEYNGEKFHKSEIGSIIHSQENSNILIAIEYLELAAKNSYEKLTFSRNLIGFFSENNENFLCIAPFAKKRW